MWGRDGETKVASDGYVGKACWVFRVTKVVRVFRVVWVWVRVEWGSCGVGYLWLDRKWSNKSKKMTR